MNRSLSVVLPVHNVEPMLAESVEEILEVLGELTSRFELIVIDDGSTDATWEAAKDLARGYPQVRLLREGVRRGSDHWILQSRRIARGDAVIAHDGKPGIDARAISRLWRSMSMSEYIAEDGGFHLLAPGAIEELRRSVAKVNEIAWKEKPLAMLRPRMDRAAESLDKETRRPNFLSRMKRRVRDFTAGE